MPKSLFVDGHQIRNNDNNPGVGPAGNAMARVNVQNYLNRGACAILHEQLEAPLFPQRFDRSELISEALSVEIFNEIKKNNGLDSNNYLTNHPNQLVAVVAANPQKFPVIIGLTNAQRDAVLKQLEVTYADHSLKADINAMTLNLIEQGCGIINSNRDHNQHSTQLIWPNPASSLIHLPNIAYWELADFSGRTLSKGSGSEINVTELASGIYFIKVNNEIFRAVVLH